MSFSCIFLGCLYCMCVWEAQPFNCMLQRPQKITRKCCCKTHNLYYFLPFLGYSFLSHFATRAWCYSFINPILISMLQLGSPSRVTIVESYLSDLGFDFKWSSLEGQVERTERFRGSRFTSSSAETDGCDIHTAALYCVCHSPLEWWTWWTLHHLLVEMELWCVALNYISGAEEKPAQRMWFVVCGSGNMDARSIPPFALGWQHSVRF